MVYLTACSLTHSFGAVFNPLRLQIGTLAFFAVVAKLTPTQWNWRTWLLSYRWCLLSLIQYSVLTPHYRGTYGVYVDFNNRKRKTQMITACNQLDLETTKIVTDFDPKTLPGNSRHSQCAFLECLGPLHTRTKCRDHEIVRAQKKVSKGCLNTPPKIMQCGHRSSSVVWSHMWLHITCISMNFYSCGSSHVI